MVDAPEKIWIEQDECPYFYEESELTEVGSPVTEYTRSDLVAELEAENEWLKQTLKTANEQVDEAEALVETLKHEAQLHAQEARTANATIAEIYREVSGGKGEPGNWNGAEPVRAELTALRARVAELEAALKTIARHPIENVCKGRPDLGIPGYASCQDVARAALKGTS